MAIGFVQTDAIPVSNCFRKILPHDIVGEFFCYGMTMLYTENESVKVPSTWGLA